ncbi:MAG: HD domain-containing protein [Candidatus Aenigmatarchaeota archaeon]
MEFLDFVSEIGKLKDIERTGWKIRGVKKPESVSDHSFRVAILVLLYSNRLDLDGNKCLKMALLHDIQEVYTGDIATRFKEEDQIISNIEKRRMESEGFEKLISKLPMNHGKELKDIWEEFFNQETDEARFVNDMDKIEMVLQALEYFEKGGMKDADEFFRTAENSIKTDIGRKLLEYLKERYFEVKRNRK